MNKLDIISEESQNKGVSGEVQGMIEGTPFTVILVGEKYRLSLKTNLITKKEFESIEEAKEWLKNIDWNDLITIIGIVTEEYRKYRECKDNLPKAEKKEGE